jgi:hypothetical protein
MTIDEENVENKIKEESRLKSPRDSYNHIKCKIYDHNYYKNIFDDENNEKNLKREERNNNRRQFLENLVNNNYKGYIYRKKPEDITYVNYGKIYDEYLKDKMNAEMVNDAIMNNDGDEDEINEINENEKIENSDKNQNIEDEEELNIWPDF